MDVSVAVESVPSSSIRARQLSAMFDVPPADRQRLEWKGEVPIEAKPWHVGLIVGPSGCGKSTLLNRMFGAPAELTWGGDSVVDDFGAERPIADVVGVCQAVGFNTIPAWLRPYRVLSNGEQFRVDLARRLLEAPSPVIVDEFTSVVDRQVAQIGAHAVQKYMRKGNRQFVAASCHYDIVEWLQPDWTLEPTTMTFQWRVLRRRPELEVTICRVPYAAWGLFAPFHYLTAELHRGARCYALFVGERIASFAGILYLPHTKVTDIRMISRGVTLPDFQGLGLMMILITRLGALYKACGLRARSYPAHPPWIRSHDRSPDWAMRKKPGVYAPANMGGITLKPHMQGGRPNAVFEYVGPAAEDVELARHLVLDKP